MSASMAPWAATISTSLANLLPTPLALDVTCAVVGIVGATAWLGIWSYLAGTGRVDPKISRKIVHCGSGPLFLLTWPLFSAAPEAQLVAAIVPSLSAYRLVMAGGGFRATVTALAGPSSKQATQQERDAEAAAGGPTKRSRDVNLVAAISRSGRAAEVVEGPLAYTLVLFFAVLFGWQTVPAIAAISQMAAGDGVADIVGRKFGTVKWPWSATKSIAGSLAFAVGGAVVTYLELLWFKSFGLIELTPDMLFAKVALLSVTCALVEILPLQKVLGRLGDDNLSVPATAAILSSILLLP